MASKKAAKRAKKAPAKKKSSAKKAAKKSSSRQEACNDNDAILKTIFIVLGVAVIIAAYWVGYLVASGGGVTTPTGGAGSADAESLGINLENARTIGNPDASVIMVEYSSLTCPYCQRYHTETFDSVKSQFVDSGDILYVYKHFPRNDMDVAAANAAECAGEQGAFFEYVDTVFANQQQLSESMFSSWAQELGLDVQAFEECVAAERYTSKATSDRDEARSFGIGGTPGFRINDQTVSGAQPLNVFEEAIEQALASEPTQPSEPSEPSQPSQPSQEPSADVSADDDAFLGEDDAPVTIIEFTDYECPFCKRHFEDTKGQIIENYVETGDVKYVVRDFPLSMHPNAQKAAEAAECAGEQGEYFAMHDLLFENQESLSVSNYKSWAADLGLDTGAFDECLDSDAMAQEVQDDFSDGRAAGVSGTPGFFINGEMVSGAQPYNVFEQAIEQALAE